MATNANTENATAPEHDGKFCHAIYQVGPLKITNCYEAKAAGTEVSTRINYTLKSKMEVEMFASNASNTVVLLDSYLKNGKGTGITIYMHREHINVENGGREMFTASELTTNNVTILGKMTEAEAEKIIELANGLRKNYGKNEA